MNSSKLLSLVLASMAIGSAFGHGADGEGQALSGTLARFLSQRNNSDISMLASDDKDLPGQVSASTLRDDSGLEKAVHSVLYLLRAKETAKSAGDVAELAPGTKTGSDSTSPPPPVESAEHKRELETEVAHLKKQLEMRDEQVKKLGSVIAASEARQDKQAIAKLEAKEAQIQKLERDLKRLEGDMRQSKASLEDKTSAHQASLAEIRQRDEAITKLNKDLEALRSGSEQMKEALKSETEARDAEMAQLKANLQAANKSKESSLSDQQAKNKAIKELQDEAGKRVARIFELENEIKSLNTHFRGKETALNYAFVQKEKFFVEQVKARDSTIEKQKSELEELRSKIQAKTKTEGERATELTNKEELIQKLEANLKQLERLFKDSQYNLRGKTDEHKASLQEIEWRDNTIQKLRADVDLLESSLRQLKGQLDNWSKAHDEKAAELETRDATIRELQAELNNIKSDLESEKSSRLSKVAELRRKSEAMKKLEVELDNLKQAVQSGRSNLKAISSCLKVANELCES